jgi:TetR/AcrR family transcriptional regulator, mexJK operon transcriptional repressor
MESHDMQIMEVSQEIAIKVAPRMGRPVDPTKDSAILKAARHAFFEQPYDRVSMDAVAERAGVSKVTIYSKFKSKDGLFIAAIRESSLESYEKMQFETDTSGQIKDNLCRLGESFMRMITNPEVTALHSLMMRESERHPELPLQFYQTVVNRSVSKLSDTLRLATESGALNCEDPRRAAIQFMALIQGNFLYELELGVEKKLNEAAMIDYVDACVDLFIRGYSKQP